MIAEPTEAGAHIEASPTDTVGNSSAPPLVQLVPPSTWGMPLGVMIISQDAWTEVVNQLAMLTVMVGHMVGKV